jgi:hypothetical protein
MAFSQFVYSSPLVVPQGLKPTYLLARGGTAEEAAEKVSKGAKNSPQALKRDALSMTYGTTEVVPFPKTRVNQSFSAAGEAVPYPKPEHNLETVKPVQE